MQIEKIEKKIEKLAQNTYLISLKSWYQLFIGIWQILFNLKLILGDKINAFYISNKILLNTCICFKAFRVTSKSNFFWKLEG